MLFSPHDKPPSDFVVIWTSKDGARLIQRFPKFSMANRFLARLERDMGVTLGYVSPAIDATMPYCKTIRIQKKVREGQAKLNAKDAERLHRAAKTFKIIGRKFEPSGSPKDDLRMAQDALRAFDRDRTRAGMWIPGGRIPSREDWLRRISQGAIEDGHVGISG